jgi:hypothetical protein
MVPSGKQSRSQSLAHKDQFIRINKNALQVGKPYDMNKFGKNTLLD